MIRKFRSISSLSISITFFLDSYLDLLLPDFTDRDIEDSPTFLFTCFILGLWFLIEISPNYPTSTLTSCLLWLWSWTLYLFLFCLSSSLHFCLTKVSLFSLTDIIWFLWSSACIIFPSIDGVQPIDYFYFILILFKSRNGFLLC